VIAKTLQTFDQSPSGVFRLQSIKQVGPGFAVRFPALDHVIGYDQDRVGHSWHCTLPATATGQPPVLRTQIGVFGPGGRVSRLHEGGPQEAIALAGRARRTLPALS